MQYTTPLPPGVTRLVHALFAAVIALYLAFPTAALLDVVLGPFSDERLRQVFLGSAVLAFVVLLWFNHRRLARAAERERLGLAGPPGGTNLLVAGLIALALSAVALAMALAPDTVDRGRALEAFSMFRAGGTAAVTLGARRIRLRRRWREREAAAARTGG